LQNVALHKPTEKRSGTFEMPSDEPDLNLAELFQAHYTRIYNYLCYRVDVRQDAEDLVGAVFERAYTHWQQFDAAKGSFSTWLFRIAHNTLVDYHRKRTRHSAWETGAEPPSDLTTSEPSLESQIVKQEAIVQLLQSLRHLSERDQEIISLKFAGKLRNKEIGEVMEMKEKTVSVALLRAMRRLRQGIENEATA